MRRILLIDDNPDFYEPISELLEFENYSVEVINNADEAVEKVKSFSEFNLIILDMMFMKGEKINLKSDESEVGIHIYHHIRRHFQNIPILVTTALQKEQIWKNFESDKKCGFYGKPVISNYTSFLLEINNLL